jgi:hypothetical protein
VIGLGADFLGVGDSSVGHVAGTLKNVEIAGVKTLGDCELKHRIG